jgi:hypothetical protein
MGKYFELSDSKLRRMEIATACSLVFALYAFSYVALPFRPSASNPGWWVWNDQGEYLRSAQALFKLDFSPVVHLSPPLYALTGVIFLPVLPLHPFFFVNAAFLLTFVTAFIHIGGRIYGRIITWSVLGLTLWCFFPVTLLQWEIPWTTTLTAGLVSILFSSFFRLSTKGRPWSVDRRSDYGNLVAFYLAYGAVFAARPIDVFPLFPMALVLYAKVFRTIIADQGIKNWKVLLTTSSAVVAAGLFFPAAYLLFNLLVFGDAFGGYISLGEASGYYPANVFQKAISLLFDGGTIYAEGGTALKDHFWPVVIALPVLLVSMVRAPLFVRIMSLSILLHICIYVPFRALLPVNLFRFMLIHYFKWTLPWMVLIATGQIVTWLMAGWRKMGALPELIATAALVVVALNIGLTFPSFEMMSDRRDGTRKNLDTELLQARSFDVLDISHLPSDLSQTIFMVNLDGRRLRNSEFLQVPAPWGTRLVFIRPEFGRRLQLRFAPSVTALEDGVGTSRVGSYRYSFNRLFGGLSEQAFAADQPSPYISTPDRFRVSFASGGGAEPFLGKGWAGPEEWGSWTDDLEGVMVVPHQDPSVRSIEVLLKPLLSNLRHNQWVSLTVNECRLVNVELQYPDDDRLTILSSSIPSECIKSDKPVRILIATDQLATPSGILSSNFDRRHLGLRLFTLSMD